MSKDIKKAVTVSAEIAGRTMTLEYGRVAQQATSSIMARYGDTVLLITVVMGKDRPEMGYFPLSVDYVERLYAGGRIKGSRWVKREGRPTDEAVLFGRIIDRSIRPLFPDNFTREVQVLVHELSVDGDNDPEILGLIGVSAALSASPIPWDGPVAVTKVGTSEDTFIANPVAAQREASPLELVVSGKTDVVNMIEAGAKEIPDDVFVKAVEFAHEHNQSVLKLINELTEKVNPAKVEIVIPELDSKLVKEAETFVKKEIAAMEKAGNEISFDPVFEAYRLNNEELEYKEAEKVFSKVWKKTIRGMIADGKRTDGRKFDEIRPIGAEVGVLPRVHGSALFSRGSTQALTVATLGTPAMEQLIETSAGEESKRYIHHYSFPPYSVGETGRIGSPGRREIGHGALAEKALEPVIPDAQTFPYTIRLVSEILSSNGSTSQASVSGSTLALMDAGVPIIRPVAGVAMGLIHDAPGGALILSDIAGIEDFNGDMDFKVAGTEKGITAVQLDVKIPGLTMEWVKEIISRARVDRMFILGKMLEALPEARTQLSEYAPKIVKFTINPEKIGEVIGPGGKMIRRIISDCGASVDIEDNGSVVIAAVSSEAVTKAKDWVLGIVTDPEVGKIYQGTVTRLMNFGAFVEIMPGKEGLVHVSRMGQGFVEDPGEVVKEGEQVDVKLTEIDDMGRLNLTMRLDDTDEPMERRPQGGGGRPPHRGGGGRPSGFRGGRDRGGDRRGGRR